MHDLEHLTFLLVGLLFWDQVISPINATGRLSLLGRAVVVLVGMFVSWGLAIVIAYATHPLYAYPTPTGGLTLLGDQEIAAGVMWVPGGTPFVIALLYLGIRWFELDDRTACERRGSAAVTTTRRFAVGCGLALLVGACARAACDVEPAPAGHRLGWADPHREGREHHSVPGPSGGDDLLGVVVRTLP